ncbi:MAG TPA: hypothetical protein ENK45_03540 [Aliiroseovarius sp.]|nr:hypothetical protein [Aliiroseovarius sp.]
MALFTDPVPAVRAAAFALAEQHPELFQDDEALAAIRAGIAEHPQAATAAARAWVAIRGEKGIKGFRHVMEKPDLPLDYRLGVVTALRAAGPRAAPYLVPAIKDNARQLRLDAMTALAELAQQDATWPNPAGEALLAALRGELVPAPPEPEEPEEVDADFAEEEPAKKVAFEQAEIDETLPLQAEEGSTLDSILNPAPPPIARNMEVVTPEPDADMEHLLEVAARTGFDHKKVRLDIDVAPHEDVRRFAATVLGNVPRADVVEALTEALDDDDPEVVTAALTSLAEIGARTGLPEDLMGPLADFLATGPAPDRPLVARALSYIPGDEVDEWLRDLADEAGEEAPQTRIEAIQGLERRGHAPDLLRAALADANPGVACAAARALARVQGARAVPDLVGFACTNDGTWRMDVAGWLADSAPEAAIDGFVALLRDEAEKRNWLVAIDALAVLLAHWRDAPTQVAA